MKKKKTSTTSIEKKTATNKPKTVDKKKSSTSKAKQAKEKKTTTPVITNPLGKKHTCYACGKKFYDLNKPQAICPSCGADQKSKPAQKIRAAKMRYTEFDVIDEDVPVLDEDMEFQEEAELEDEVLDEEE